VTRDSVFRTHANRWRARFTHDVEEAVTLADRVVIIDHGKIVLETPVALPRPRRRDSPSFSVLAQEILTYVLGLGQTIPTGNL
jgi:sulfonate transport system ATP-binding protein